jgi:acyl-CoA reductase-like NAD-dependent aldehyde dehydrogenase
MSNLNSNQPNTNANVNAQAVAISRNPANDELIATYAFQTPSEVERVLDANAAAFPPVARDPDARARRRLWPLVRHLARTLGNAGRAHHR